MYFVILLVLAFITNSLPKSSEPLKGLFAVIALFWMVGGVFILLRAGFRFITR
jgi:hypothetical protein